MPAKQARSLFGDRVSRAFLRRHHDQFAVALHYNALLATETRLEARRCGERSIFGDKP